MTVTRVYTMYMPSYTQQKHPPPPAAKAEAGSRTGRKLTWANGQVSRGMYMTLRLSNAKVQHWENFNNQCMENGCTHMSDAKPLNAHSTTCFGTDAIGGNQTGKHGRAPATASTTHGYILEAYRHVTVCTKCNDPSNALRPGSRRG